MNLRKATARVSLIAIILFVSSVISSATCAGGSSLIGSYGVLINSNGGGKYLAGTILFDGNCNVSGGTVTGGDANGQYFTAAVTGTYVQNSDGTYNLNLNLAGQPPTQTYIIGLSESGNKARGIESDGTGEVTIELQSQMTTLSSGYTTASLNGTYAASCYGGSSVDLNYVTFDGNGGLTGVNPYNNSGSQGNNPYSGTYTVNSDGTFSGALAGGYSSFSFNGVIDTGVSEIKFVYELSGSAVVACSGKQFTGTNLSGYYGFLIAGSPQNQYISGSLFLSAGTLTGSNISGVIGGTYQYNTTVTGTYAPNPDNTITINLNLVGGITQTYIVGVSESGNEAVGIQTDASATVATIDLQRQLQLPATNYTVASLQGTYSAYCFGSEVDLNYVTFDGVGGITGVDPYDNGAFGNSPYTGNYTVNSDGTFIGTFNAPIYNVFTMTGVLENGTAEMEYTYDQSGVGGVVACVGESTYGPVGTNPVVATPTFSPAPGAFGSSQAVVLADSIPDAVIYYTTDGTPPSTLSSVYSSSITVSSTTTIQAIAAAPNSSNSALAAGTYFITAGLPAAAAPNFSPAPGTYSGPVSVILSDSTPSATIYYTTNGTAPNTGSAVFSGSIPVSATTTIEAIAVATGYSASSIATGVYTIVLPTAATPSFNPAPGTYNSPLALTVSDTTPGAVVHCTTDGSTPGPGSPVCSSLTLTANTTIKAIAVASGYNNSAILTGTYTITSSGPTVINLGAYYNIYGIGTVGTNPKSGGFDNDSYDFNTATLGATATYQGLSFTLGTPNALDAISSQTVPIASGPYTQIFLLGAGVNGAQTNQSIVVTYTDGTTGTFTQNFSDWANPQKYTGETTVLSASNRIAPNGQTQTFGVNVFGYTLALAAGKTPASVKLPANRNVVFLGIGLGTAVTPTAATPTFSPAPGTYNSIQTVTLSDTTSGAVIHYTTDGSTPTASSTTYSSALSISSTTTLKAIAIANGYNNSAVASGTYIINLPTAATPTFSPAPGSYNSVVTVTLSDSTSGAAIYYTTNGSTPTTSSTRYTSPFSVGTTTTVEAIAAATGYLNSGVATGVYTITGTPIVPYVQVNGAAWQQTASATVSWGSVVNLGPQPLNGGSWSWTGPNGFTSSAREIDSIPLVSGTNTFVATYTNPGGVKTTQTFTISVTGTPIVPYIQVNGASWQQTATANVSRSSNVNLGPQPLGGTWSWTGPNGFTSKQREIDNIPLSKGTNTYIATYTNSSGQKSSQTFTVNAN